MDKQAEFPPEVKVKVAQWCPILCDPMDYTVHGILQARILEWVAFPFSRRSSQPRDRTPVFHIAGRFCLPTEPQGKPRNTAVGGLVRTLMPWNYSLNYHQFEVQHIFMNNQYTLTIEIHSWGCEMQSVANIYKHGPLYGKQIIVRSTSRC